MTEIVTFPKCAIPAVENFIKQVAMYGEYFVDLEEFPLVVVEHKGDSEVWSAKFHTNATPDLVYEVSYDSVPDEMLIHAYSEEEDED